MKELIKDIAIAFLIAFAVMLVVKPTIVKESSMEPNFYENNYLMISRRSYDIHEPARGDVIIFHSSLVQENGREKLLIKRIIGLPGETIDVIDGSVYIDGKLIEEDYIKEPYTTGLVEGLVVPEGQYFCMGDNRGVSIDSRFPEIGCVKKEDIMGKVFLRLYPFNQMGFIKNPYK